MPRKSKELRALDFLEGMAMDMAYGVVVTEIDNAAAIVRTALIEAAAAKKAARSTHVPVVPPGDTQKE